MGKDSHRNSVRMSKRNTKKQRRKVIKKGKKNGTEEDDSDSVNNSSISSSSSSDDDAADDDDDDYKSRSIRRLDVVVKDKDILLDVESHPGNYTFRKAIRLVVKDYPDEPYSKSIFRAVKSHISMDSCVVIYIGDPYSRSSHRHHRRLREPTRTEFMDAVRQAYEEGQVHRKKWIQKKKKKQKRRNSTHNSCSSSADEKYWNDEIPSIAVVEDEKLISRKALKSNSSDRKQQGEKMKSNRTIKSAASKSCAKDEENLPSSRKSAGRAEATTRRRSSRVLSVDKTHHHHHEENVRDDEDVSTQQRNSKQRGRDRNYRDQKKKRNMKHNHSLQSAISSIQDDEDDNSTLSNKTEDEDSMIRPTSQQRQKSKRKNGNKLQKRKIATSKRSGSMKTKTKTKFLEDDDDTGGIPSKIIVQHNNTDSSSIHSLDQMERGDCFSTKINGNNNNDDDDDDSQQDLNIFFDSPDHPGTIKWNKAVRWVVKHFGSSSSSSKRALKRQPEFSDEIFHSIKQRLKGRRYYYSKHNDDDDDDGESIPPPQKVKKKDLFLLFEECFEREWHMVHHAENDDVYFEAPLHRGTRMWRQAVQTVVQESPHSKYDGIVYRNIKQHLKELDCPNFYVGNPPNSHREATKRELVDHCRKCFKGEKKRLILLAAKQQQKRLVVQNKKRDKTTPTDGSHSTSTTSKEEGIFQQIDGVGFWPKERRGNAARAASRAKSKRCTRWKNLRTRWKNLYPRMSISNRLHQWPWYQQSRHKVLHTNVMVQFRQFLQDLARDPITIRIKHEFRRCKRALQTDPETGRDVWDRLDDQLQIPIPPQLIGGATGYSTSWPMWAALGIAVILFTFTTVTSIFKSILLKNVVTPLVLLNQKSNKA